MNLNPVEIYKKIKALLVVKREVEKIQKEVGKMKSGWKTSEFWVTVASSVAAIWFAVSGLIPADLSLKVMGAVAMIYTIARAIVKFTPSTKDDELLDRIVEATKKK